MRTETITKEIYSFDELSEEAQQYAIEKFRDSDSYLDYDWWDFIYEDWVDKLAEHGFDVITTENRMSYKWDKDLNRRVENGKKDFKEININFSGFYSQGDGASFTCKRIDVKQWIIKNNLKKYGRLVKLIDSNVLDISGCIKRDRWHNYIHWNTISVYLNVSYYGDYKSNLSNIGILISQLEDDIQEHAQELSKEIYRDLEKEYDYLMSDECIQETILANDYEFEQYGTRY